MNVIYTTELIKVDLIRDYPTTMFLAGPSPRGNEDGAWRPEAVEYLEAKGYEGLVFNPEQRTKGCIDFSKVDYPAAWEHTAIACSRVLVFWVPRELKHMPAFTTNIEFGYFIDKYPSDRILYGRPDDAPKNRYLDFLWEKCHPQSPIYKTLPELLDAAITADNNVMAPTSLPANIV